MKDYEKFHLWFSQQIEVGVTPRAIYDYFATQQQKVSDEEIHNEAFKRQEQALACKPLHEFNMTDFKTGAKWLRDEQQGEKCEYCNGYGYTAEHDPTDPHIDGICNNCPIQVQCQYCNGTGTKPPQQGEKATPQPDLGELEKEFNELQDLAKWMTGAYHFADHEYFRERRYLLTFKPHLQPNAVDWEKLKIALEEIVNPIRFMRERLKEDEQLNGLYASQMADSANYLRTIAEKALKNFTNE